MNSGEKTSYASSRASSYDPQRKRTHTRRPHRKTKTGCLTCKKRKIKCDESRPECDNCIKHTLECAYAPSKVHVSATGTALSSSGSHVLNLIDMELLHNYCTSTALTLHRDPAIVKLWSITVPQFGFLHDYVMHGILALSALHMAYCFPERKEICTEQAALHHKSGLIKATPALSTFAEENASAMYLFSALTCLYTYTTLGQTDDSVLGGESGWIFLSRQSYSLIRMANSTLRNGPLGPLFLAGERRNRLRDEAESITLFAEADPLVELSARIEERIFDQDALQAYSTAINDMIKIFKAMKSVPEEQREASDVFRWPFQLEEGFLERLQIPTQETLVIIAHFAIIPEYLSSKWWLRGFGRRLLARICPLIDEEHLSWIQWPMQQLGVTREGGFQTSSYGTPMNIAS
ncbi:hypothetical protein BKA64DRAFT_475215 [Cadophora sp. MPI-SDFR-AT-0126]|nr:hypothetical protein BKA64DRAFT_475215 [Leotiomycetes sp. MPI-SDFR-AT-0126]